MIAVFLSLCLCLSVPSPQDICKAVFIQKLYKNRPLQSRIHSLTSCLSKTPSRAKRKEFVLSLTKAFIQSDIPLEKAPKLATFFQKYCKQGGSVPYLKETGLKQRMIFPI
uniref:Uncharacterized protein n=1 Tax=Monopterus albus TaxID=43700 RepID=A0A3Q3IYX0_MONAL